MSELVCAKIVISGIVQGVGYRYFALRKASQYGLKGYVQNLYNNDDVEVVAEGEKSLILDFIKELKIGPRAAHVTDLKIQWETYQGKFQKFDIKF
jgi:acylphosphatase